MVSKRSGKVIYTAIFGGYEGLLPQQERPGWDFVCFTDDDSLAVAPWRIAVIAPPVPGDPVRSSRFVKINPDLFLPDYAVSIFMDGNFLAIGNPDRLVDTLLKDTPIACFDHAQNTQDPRDCIYKEHAALVQLAETRGIRKDDPDLMRRQMDVLRAEGYPNGNGLVYSGVLLRRHRESALIKAMRDWWEMVKNYSCRDQLSFDYALWKNRLHYAIIPGDSRRGNGYFYMLGKHRKDWRAKLLGFRLKKRFGMIKTNG